MSKWYPVCSLPHCFHPLSYEPHTLRLYDNVRLVVMKNALTRNRLSSRNLQRPSRYGRAQPFPSPAILRSRYAFFMPPLAGTYLRPPVIVLDRFRDGQRALREIMFSVLLSPRAIPIA
jgi:hypothetical protein